jgi:hypothetical protein
MRHVRFLASFRRRLIGAVVAAGLALTGVGCHQNYYYYSDPCTPGTTVPSTVRTGPVCEVPTQVVEGGTTVADVSGRSTVVTGATTSTKSSRVVVSEPSEPAKLAWKRADPDGPVAATTSVQGNLSDTTINR